MHHPVKFRENWSNGCGDIAILRFFLTAGTLERENLLHGVKFRQDRLILLSYGNFSIFKMAAVRHVVF